MLRTALKVTVGLIGVLLFVVLALSATRDASLLGYGKAVVALAVTYQLIALIGREPALAATPGEARGLSTKQIAICVALGLAVPLALLGMFWAYR